MGDFLSKYICHEKSSVPIEKEPKLISVSILHRHGSRGPGESELGPWKSNPECPVHSQWAENELENLTTFGHKQCESLGVWFNDYATSKSLGKDDSRVFFRSSKSGRGKESGQDFIRGFNSARDKHVNTTPNPYENGENVDNYFRPWKILPLFSETLKHRMSHDPVWTEKAEENKELLVEVFKRVGAENLLSKLEKALWATTYLHSVKECEIFWPRNEGKSRLVLTNMLNETEWEGISGLACWVWEERFVRSGFTVSMGGKLTHEILTRALDPQIDISIYSAHDYTVLAALSLLDVIPKIEGPANFACYVLFELWDDTPPAHPSGPARKKFDRVEGDDAADSRVLRVIFNALPISCEDSSDLPKIQTQNEKVLGEFSMKAIQELITLAQTEFHQFAAVAHHDHGNDENNDEHHDVHMLLENDHVLRHGDSIEISSRYIMENENESSSNDEKR